MANDLILRVGIDGDKVVVKGLKDVEKQTKKTGAGAKGAGKDAKSMGSQFKQVATQAKALVGGLIALQSARKAVELGKLSASAKNVERAFRNLAKQPDAMLQSMKKATAGTIDEMTLMQQFNQASLLGLPLERFDEMLEIARGSAQATGQSMDYMLSSIVTGLGRGSKLMLDNLGIMIDTQGAQEKYAEKLGLTSDKLTDLQKKQAFVNEAMDLGSANLEKAGGVMDTNVDIYGRFDVAIKELGLQMGEVLAPAVESTLVHLTDFINLLDPATLKKYSSSLIGIASAYGIYVTAVNIANLKTIKFQATLIKTGWGALIVGAGLAIGKLIEMSGAFGNLKVETALANQEIEKLSARGFAMLSDDKQRDKVKETIETLREMFTVGSAGSKAFEASVKKTAWALNMQGKTIQDIEGIIDGFVKAGVLARKVASETDTSSYDKWIAEQKIKLAQVQQELKWKNKLKIENESLAKSLGFFADEEKKLTEIKQAQEEVYRNNLAFQLLSVDIQAEKYSQMGLDQVAIDQFVAESKTEIALKQMEEQNALWNASFEAYDTFVDTMLDKSMTGAERQQKVWESFKNSIVKFSAEMLKDWIKNQILKNVIAKQGESGAIASAIVTGKSIASAYATSASLVSTSTFGASAGAGLTALLASIASTKALALAEGGQFETSGPQMLIVGDNPSGRERVTVEPLGGDSGFQAQSNNITVNISAPLIDETVRDSIIPAIQQAISMELS